MTETLNNLLNKEFKKDFGKIFDLIVNYTPVNDAYVIRIITKDRKWVAKLNLRSDSGSAYDYKSMLSTIYWHILNNIAKNPKLWFVDTNYISDDKQSYADNRVFFTCYSASHMPWYRAFYLKLYLALHFRHENGDYLWFDWEDEEDDN